MPATARLPLAIVLVAVAAVPAIAAAGSCRATLVTTTFAFGTYDPFSTIPLDSTGQLELRCSAKSMAQVSLSEGNSGTFHSRELRAPGGGVLQYNVYLDASRQTVWSTTDIYFATERTEIVPMFGRVPPRQLGAAVGAYTDTLTLTVSF